MCLEQASFLFVSWIVPEPADLQMSVNFKRGIIISPCQWMENFWNSNASFSGKKQDYKLKIHSIPIKLGEVAGLSIVNKCLSRKQPCSSQELFKGGHRDEHTWFSSHSSFQKDRMSQAGDQNLSQIHKAEPVGKALEVKFAKYACGPPTWD